MNCRGIGTRGLQGRTIVGKSMTSRRNVDVRPWRNKKSWGDGVRKRASFLDKTNTQGSCFQLRKQLRVDFLDDEKIYKETGSLFRLKQPALFTKFESEYIAKFKKKKGKEMGNWDAGREGKG